MNPRAGGKGHNISICIFNLVFRVVDAGIDMVRTEKPVTTTLNSAGPAIGQKLGLRAS